MTDLASACAAWQDGRDGGSSPIRAAARVLTGTPHYFTSDYIEAFEADAAANPTTLGRAQLFLEALQSGDRHDIAGWAQVLGVRSGWAGRGVKQRPDEDPQILEAIATGRIRMPLWGISLDRRVAERFGNRFLFEVRGTFPAIPACLHSGIKAEEQELIVGGTYIVEDVVEEDPGCTRVALRFDGLIDLAEAAPASAETRR